MFDFGALPPEINSARMYSGPGSAPMLVAASAWDVLAAELELYAAGYSSALSALQSQWSGGTSMAMTGAVTPYVAWATATAAHAAQAACQARAAAAAFETAFAATVPPPAVAANRMQLAILIATNFFGQNAPAIAATEAQYAEMWAQDAAAMYGYAASSSAATALTPFTQPPQTTNAGGRSAQAAAVSQAASTSAGHTQTTLAELMSALPQHLQTLASGTPTGTSAADTPSLSSSLSALESSPVLNGIGAFNTLTGPANLGAAFSRTATSAMSGGTGVFRSNIQSGAGGVRPFLIGPGAAGPTGVRGPVLAGVGKAAPVGQLSVPQSWVGANAAAAPANGPVAFPDSDFRTTPVAASHPLPGTMGGIPGRGSQPMGSVVLRSGRRRFTMPRPPYGG